MVRVDTEEGDRTDCSNYRCTSLLSTTYKIVSNILLSICCHMQRKPPRNPTPHLYFRVMWITWEAVTGVEGKPCRGLLQHMLANRALVYPSQGGKYHAEGCIALDSNSNIVNDPLGEPGHTPLYSRPSVCVGLHGQ